MKQEFFNYFNTLDEQMYKNFLYYYKENPDNDQMLIYRNNINYENIFYNEKKRIVFENCREMSCGYLYLDSCHLNFDNVKDILPGSRNFKDVIDYMYKNKYSIKFKTFINTINHFIPIRIINPSEFMYHDQWLLFQRFVKLYKNFDPEEYFKDIFNMEIYFLSDQDIKLIGYRSLQDMVKTIHKDLVYNIDISDDKFKLEYLQTRHLLFRKIRKLDSYKIVRKISELSEKYNVEQIKNILRVENGNYGLKIFQQFFE